MLPTKGVESWLDELAAIMELEGCGPERYPALIFLQGSSGLSGALVSTGWRAHSLGALQIWSHPDLPDRICEIGPEKDRDLDVIRMWLALGPVYQSVQEMGGLPLHAALVRSNGVGVLLAAPGDAGKSTCCRHLPDPWQALCDDEALIVRAGHKRYLAHPFPTWSDRLRQRSERTWNVQGNLSVAAIFFLEQAEVDEVVPLGQGRAAMSVFQSATEVCRRNWRNLAREEERRSRRAVFDNACELARAIPAFTLRFSLSGQFWVEMEKVLARA